MEKKLCIDCKHCIQGPVYKRLPRPVCGLTKRVRQSSNLVEGGPDAVSYDLCYDERTYGCGREAKNFEPKPKRFPRLRRLIGR